MLHHGPHHFNLRQQYHHHPIWCCTTDRTTSIWRNSSTIIRCDATPHTAPLQSEATLPPSSDVMLHHRPHHFNLKQHYHHHPMWCYTTDRTTSIWTSTTTIVRCDATPRTASLQSEATLPPSSVVMLHPGPHHFNLKQHYHHHPMWCYTTDRTTSIWGNTTTIIRCDATPRTTPLQSDAILPPSYDAMLHQGQHHFNLRQHYHHHPMWCYTTDSTTSIWRNTTTINRCDATPRTAPLQFEATLPPSSDVMLHLGPHHFNPRQPYHHHMMWCYTSDRTTSIWGNTTTIIRCYASPRTAPLQSDSTIPP